MFRFLLGDDVFISYSRRDGAHYAAALASRLGEPEFDVSCFLDQWGASAANELSQPVIRALRRSYVLLLIGTPGAVASSMVRQEVASFSRTRFWRTNRPILPINVAGALDDVSWTELTGLNRTPETHDACTGGLPSDRVVRLVRDSCSFSRRSQRTRLVSMAAVLLLFISILASLWAYAQNSRALEASLQAEKQTLKANEASAEAQRGAEEARRAEDRAKESEARSIVARRETERQTRIAIARQRAAEAGIAVSRGNLLPEGVFTAIETMRSEALPLVEGYQVLRQGLGLLPHLIMEMRNDRPVKRISLSADARYVATASDQDGTLQVWDTQTGRKVAHKSYSRAVPFVSLAISPSGDYLAAAHGGLIEIFDLRTALRDNLGGELKPIAFRPVIRTPEGTAFSPDGKFFAAVGYQGAMARLWSVEGWKQVRDLSGSVSAVGFAPDGQHVFTVGRGGTQVNVIAAKASEPRRRSAGPAGSMAAFSLDGNYLATAQGDRLVRIWRLNASTLEWDETASFTHQGRATSLAISSSGAHVAVASEDGTARVWNTAGAREALRLTHGAKVTGVAFSRDGAYVATASEDTTTRLWSTREDTATIALAQPEDVRAVAFSQDGRSVRTAGNNGRVRSWNTSSGSEIDVRNAIAVPMSDGETPYLILAAALSPDGRRAAVAVSNGIVFTGDTEADETIELTTDEDIVALAVSAGGHLVAGSSAAGIDVWRSTEPGKPLHHFKGSGFRSVAFSNDGRLLAAGDGRGVRLWDMSSGREMRRLITNEAINVVCFSSDGTRLAAAGVGQFYVWEVSSTAPPVRVPSGAQHIHAMALSPDGRFFALAGSDTTVRVREVSGGREVARLVHDATVAALAFSPDGARLATASRDNTARVSVWKPEDLIQEACNRLPRQFKAEGGCRGSGITRLGSRVQ